MTPTEAKKKLNLHEILRSRGKGRVFGNIDTDLNPLTATEVIALHIDIHFTSEKIKDIFERDDTFFKSIQRRNGL